MVVVVVGGGGGGGIPIRTDVGGRRRAGHRSGVLRKTRLPQAF
eukprot:ctg_1988.g552